MQWQYLAWGRLADVAAGALIVLAAGSLAARFCRQPVRRARLVVLTLLGAVAVPCLGALPVTPAWSARLLPAPPRPSLDHPPAAGSMASVILPEAARSRDALERADRPGETTADTRRPELALAPTGPVKTSPGWGWAVPPPRTMVLGCYLAAASALAAWWLLGQLALWRVTRAARPVPGPVREALLGIAGPGGERVMLLESDRIALPFTYTWARPVILLPATLCDRGDTAALRYVLAHEWSHVERRDAWAWNLACLAGLVLCYQPLFWWLRRQLRLCQDYLADDRAAAAGSPEDYAAFLVRFARVRTPGPAVPALGIGDRRSNLARRVVMLVQDREPLERRCRAAWSLAAASAAAAVIVAASGLRLSAAAPPPEDRAPPKEVKDDKAGAAKIEGARTWKGRITERGTGKPIAGADVVVEISLSRDKTTNEPRTLRNVPQTTGADGGYEFTVTPEEAAERLLYITLHVQAQDHVNYFGGYSYGMILKNEKLGERPFYENLQLAPGKAIEGVLKTPEGGPAAGVMVKSFSTPDSKRIFDDGRFGETKTDAQGRFRLVLHPEGKAVFWLLPQEYSPETHGLKNDLRGDLGAFTLDKGIRFGGRLLDSQGKPVGGVYVEADLQRAPGDDDDAVPPGIADQIHRATLTAADGTFAFRPLPPGTYRVYPSIGGWDPSTRDGAHDPKRRPLPAVFTSQQVTLKEGETPEPVEIRAVPHVVVEAQLYTSKGVKRSGHEINLVGQIDGGFWSTECHPTPDGSYRMLAPHGLEDAQIMLVTNEHSALQFRMAKGAPLQRGRTIRLGMLDHDVKGIEIVRYEAPIILINATTKDGTQVKGFRPSVNYTEPGPNGEGKFILKGGGRSDVSFEDQHPDGRFRTSQLVPDREVEVTVQADGFQAASRKMSLPEGKIEAVTFVLEPK